LGFVVIQGYGLTETAPIVTLNHPFKTSTGSVGKPVGGVEVRIAEDGEILVRGENVTEGYYQGETGAGADQSRRSRDVRDADEVSPKRPPAEGERSREGEWLHTGDVGELDAEGRL